MRVCDSLEVSVNSPAFRKEMCNTDPGYLSDSLIDYIAISGTMERNVLEFVDHLHEHFLYPCSINKSGRYNVPNNAREGYRCELPSYICL